MYLIEIRMSTGEISKVEEAWRAQALNYAAAAARCVLLDDIRAAHIEMYGE
jgi:hypothetical protein